MNNKLSSSRVAYTDKPELDTSWHNSYTSSNCSGYTPSDFYGYVLFSVVDFFELFLFRDLFLVISFGCWYLARENREEGRRESRNSRPTSNTRHHTNPPNQCLSHRSLGIMVFKKSQIILYSTINVSLDNISVLFIEESDKKSHMKTWYQTVSQKATITRNIIHS